MPPTRPIADRVAVSRCRVDGARPVGQHPRRLSRGSDRAGALARRAEHADHRDLARRSAGFHRIPRPRRRAAALHRAPAFQLPPLLPLPRARRRDQRRPDGADRDAEDRPLAAEVADRRRSRVAARARRSSAIRSAIATAPCSRCCTPRACASPSSSTCVRPGQHQPGRHPHSRQGQSRAADSARRGSGALADRFRRGAAQRDPARAHRPTTCSRRAAAIA